MILPVHRPEVLPIHMSVDLRGGKVGVAQHLLHGAEIRPALQQVGGEAVPERVRRHPLPDPCPRGGPFDDAPGTDA